MKKEDEVDKGGDDVYDDVDECGKEHDKLQSLTTTGGAQIVNLTFSLLLRANSLISRGFFTSVTIMIQW